MIQHPCKHAGVLLHMHTIFTSGQKNDAQFSQIGSILLGSSGVCLLCSGHTPKKRGVHPLIEVKHLTKRYGKHTAVDDISFTVQDGCIYGLLGPNGAGKSTTMNMITGYLAPTGGTVTIDGHDIQEEPKEAKACIGYLPEIPPLYTDMTVQEYLLFVSELKGMKKKADRVQDVQQAVQRAGLQEMEKRLIRNLSKGYRQRVGIAAALLGSPKVIILDEPTVGLDPAQMIEIRNLIHDLGETHTVILSSHILSEVQTICDRVLIIAHGKVAAQGTPEELAAQLAARGMIAATALGTKEQVLAAAAKVEGLTDLRVTAEKGEEVSFTATSTAGADLRAALSKALAEAGCPVVSLTSDTMSLEDIFLQITETSPEEGKAEEAKPEEAGEPEAPAETPAVQPEQPAEPAEPQAPADDTAEQPEPQNDPKEEE